MCRLLVGAAMWDMKSVSRRRLRYLVAIDQVLFLQNTSPLPDEMLAHRLGLVPLISRNVINGLRYTRVSRVERIERVERVERVKSTSGLSREIARLCMW
jgi:hypothetical protein